MFGQGMVPVPFKLFRPRPFERAICQITVWRTIAQVFRVRRRSSNANRSQAHERCESWGTISLRERPLRLSLHDRHWLPRVQPSGSALCQAKFQLESDRLTSNAWLGPLAKPVPCILHSLNYAHQMFVYQLQHSNQCEPCSLTSRNKIFFAINYQILNRIYVAPCDFT